MTRSSPRRATVALMALVCTVVASALVLLALQVSLQQRRQLRVEHQLEQTRWLLDAAIRKSIADPDFKTAELEISPEVLNFENAKVSVQPDQENKRTHVHAQIETATRSQITSRSASYSN